MKTRFLCHTTIMKKQTMSKTTFAIDPETCLVIAINLISAYTGEDFEKETMECVAVEILAGYQDNGTVSYETMLSIASIIDENLVNDEEALGQFAWILDSALDHFIK